MKKKNALPEELISAYHSYLDTLKPSEELINKIWENINSKENQKKHWFPFRVQIQAAVLVLICFALIFAVFGNGITKIRSIHSLMGFWDVDAENDIIRNIVQETEVYAPILWECSEKTLIFATARGAVVYDRHEKQIIAVIDLQNIGCHYMNTNTLATRAYIENNQLWIFNEKDGIANGSCYIYTIPGYSGEIQNLKPEHICDADSGHIEKWQQYYSGHYRSAYEAVKEYGLTLPFGEYGQNSKDIFLWTDASKKSLQSLLIIKPQDRECLLYTYDSAADVEYKEQMNISLTEDEIQQLSLSNYLPEYVYTGQSAIFAAICEYLYNEERQSVLNWENKYYNRPMVWIPAPVIFDIVEEDGEIKVFGNFYSFIYYKSGNTLECESGGEKPACIHIEENDEGYKVIDMEIAGDGNQYTKDIKKFCKGHPFIRLKYLNYNKVRNRVEEMRKELIKGYVVSQGLDIKYYHDYGQDPVAIWEE